MIRIENKLEKEIIDYCSLNQIKDVKAFVNKLLSKAFMVEKYGDTPFSNPSVSLEVNEDKQNMPSVSPDTRTHIETIVVPTIKSDNNSENKQNIVQKSKKVTKIIKR